jgi:hypothetical protein
LGSLSIVPSPLVRVSNLDLAIGLISRKLLVQWRQIMQNARPEWLAGMFANKSTKLFAHLPRLGRCGVKGARSSMRAKLRHHICRHGVGLFEPRDEVAAIRQPLDFPVPRGRDAVEKIEREIIADEEGGGARLGHKSF